MPRIVTYCRSATAEDAARLATASDALTTLIAAHPEHRLVDAGRDLGVAGLGDPLERPGLRALLEGLDREPAEILLLPAIHHLTRDRDRLAPTLAAFAQRGLQVRLASLGIDTPLFDLELLSGLAPLPSPADPQGAR